MYITVHNLSIDSNYRILAAELNYRFTRLGLVKLVYLFMAHNYCHYLYTNLSVHSSTIVILLEQSILSVHPIIAIRMSMGTVKRLVY